MNSRKIFIILVTMAVLIGVYLIYIKFSATPEFETSSYSGGTTYDKASVDANMGNIGLARLGTVRTAVYKSAGREFGFEKLLHEKGKEWTLEKPYMKIFEKNFVCGITADKGDIQVEVVANQPSPRDARLTGNVVVHIVPDSNARVKEGFLYLDSIDYSSEKSLFSTEGPVHYVSEDAEMVGKGLEIIFNKQKQRLELLHIVHVDFIHLKTYKDTNIVAQKSKNDDEKAEPVKDGTVAKTAPSGKAAKPESTNYYNCLVEKNVVIAYGAQTIYADKVVISNLYVANSKSKKKHNDANAPVNGNTSKPAQTQVARGEAAEAEFTEVNVKCDGGITVRPVEDEPGRDAAKRLVEINGSPVIITKETLTQEGKADEVEMAKCAQLKYDLDNGLLDMFADEDGHFVALNLGQGGSSLRTSKSVFWNVKDNKAVITGPGTLFMPGDAGDKNGPAQMEFAGKMRVTFGDPNAKGASVALKNVSLDGGLKGSMQKDNSTFAADSAKLAFANGNALTEADLNGNVAFDSNSGGMKAQQAKITFEKDPNGDLYAKNVTGMGDVEMKPGQGNTQAGNTIFKAQNIDYDLPRGYALASGPVELKMAGFDKVTKKELPVIITAKDNAEYFQQKNEVAFNGAVAGTITQKSGEYDEVSTFNADKLVAKLSGQPNMSGEGNQKTGLEHISLVGKVVKFVSCQQQGDKVINGLQMKCSQVDYNAVSEEIWATGPGEIVVDNSKATASESSDGGINFKGPCWVYVNNFRKLTFFKNANRILGEGVPSGLHIGYSPIKNGKSAGEDMLIDAGKLELLLTSDRKVSSLNANDGIIFDQPGKYYAQGNELHYTSENNRLNIKDNCVVNGVSAEEFILNTKTLEGKVVNFKGAMVPLSPKNSK